MKNIRLALLFAFLVTGAFADSSVQAQDASKPELKVGFVPGPYIDEFKAGVAPELVKKGYRIRYVEFSTGLEANNAVFKNEIDANVMQHTIFLNSYNERQKTDLVGIVHVPTPPMGASTTVLRCRIISSNAHHDDAQIRTDSGRSWSREGFCGLVKARRPRAPHKDGREATERARFI